MGYIMIAPITNPLYITQPGYRGVGWYVVLAPITHSTLPKGYHGVGWLCLPLLYNPLYITSTT